MELVDLCCSSRENSSSPSAKKRRHGNKEYDFVSLAIDTEKEDGWAPHPIAQSICLTDSDSNSLPSVPSRAASSSTSGFSSQPHVAHSISSSDSESEIAAVPESLDVPLVPEKPRGQQLPAERIRNVNKFMRQEEKENKLKEKEMKRKAREVYISSRPGDCMKYIHVHMRSELLNKPCCIKVCGALEENGVRVLRASSPLPDPACIRWSRLSTQAEENTAELEPHALLLLEIEELLDPEETKGHKGLVSRLSALKKATSCPITLILYGANLHFRRENNKKTAAWKDKVRGTPARVRKDAGNSKFTQNDLELCLTRLLLTQSISCWKADSPEELSQVILQFTKATAEAPYKKLKKQQDEQATFFMRGDSRSCVKIDKQGRGLLRLWSQCLTKFPKASLETAQAVCGCFPSPALLIKALREQPADSVVRQLSEAQVRRAADAAASRRVGPELAKKIVVFFSEENGLQTLSS